MNTDTTLVAVATPSGHGGIGVVRLSGGKAQDIAQQITHKKKWQPRYMHFCRFYGKDGDCIDEGMAALFPAPHSFTGEDVVELHAHGGPVILDLLVKACLSLGATQAGPGEFSLRAFLNEKLDLAQAEAIADMIDAGSEAAARAARQSLQGNFSHEIDQLVQQLVSLRVHVEAAMDFPDEEIDFLAEDNIEARLLELLHQIQATRKSAGQGRLLRDGMTLVLAGKPNAGKSSLLNALAGHDAAIVTDQAGTTRDTLREYIQIDGIPVNLIDTAGLRDTQDKIEQEGVKRAGQALQNADAILFLVDSTSEQISPELLDLLPPAVKENLSATQVTWLLNKIDLSKQASGRYPNEDAVVFGISALEGDGLDTLKQYLKQLAGWQEDAQTLFSARRRHLDALDTAMQKLQGGIANLQYHKAAELLAEDLRAAQQALEAITGRFTSDDLLGEIFSSFCIGK